MMMFETKRRAMRADQKQARRQALIDVAWHMFQTASYQAITMAEVAERAGLAKGTVYLYFKTKEELFLAIQTQQFADWFDELDARFSAAPRPASTAAVAELICASLARRAALASLLAILHTVLEQNIDATTALAFKQMLLERLTRTGTLLEACLPFMAAGQGAQILLQIYALIIGVEHLASPAPAVRQVIEQPGMAIFAIPFAPTFAAAVGALLRGYESLSA
jgi:AcrR family transcriptional regulator